MSVIKYLLSLTFLLLIQVTSYAQCAMCRTQVVNNVSNGDTALAAGLNMGIMYLFFAPYLVLGVVAYFWYKTARVNENKRNIRSRIEG